MKKSIIKNINILQGQSLVEIVIAMAIGVILIGNSVILIGASLQSSSSVKQCLQVNFLIRQESEAIESLAQNNWHSIYALSKETDYHINLSSNIWEIDSEQEVGVINNIPYKRYFQVYNVGRDSNGDISESGIDDPNTQKIVIYLDYGNNYLNSSSIGFYLIRSANNQVFHQTDWSGGEGQIGPIPNPGNRFGSAVNINFSTEGQITMATTTLDAELISSILDTGIEGGAGYNSLLWLGSFNAGGNVKFQIAFSNSPSGPWVYYGPSSSEDWYQLNPNTGYTFPINDSASPQNKRYIRYKVHLSTTGVSPKVEEVIINWCP
ncbi:MAG: hypothetical protein PHH35_02200 [Candidatus Pacebacteria bacterium]|nr:hypothetical protein [Candidatus Paceibacterota bacterium]